MTPAVSADPARVSAEPARVSADPARVSADPARELAVSAAGAGWPELPELPEGSLADEFRRRVAEHPDRPAVVADGRTLTYRELAAHADVIAGRLGPRPGERVGLLLDHGAGTVAAILATLSVGAAYVPLDPRYPLPRLHAMAAQARISAVLATPDHHALAEALAPATPVIDATWASHVAQDTSWDAHVAHEAAAYVLHTSGSTGVPKGVVQTHRNALHQVRLHRTNLAITPDDRISVVTSFGFDMAVTDTFSALLTGACCVPVDVRALGVDGLAAALRRHRVTIYHSTPTVFRYLADCLDEPLPELRAVILGGEPVTAEDLDRCRRVAGPGAALVNGYGATEISFAVQNHLPVDVSTVDGAVVPIGFPLPGVRIALLAQDGSPDTGEIAITSEFLASYWDLESDRFDVDHDGVRRYRTGDLARLLPDGRLEYLGRRDRQVKIRGFRVELAEVEHALRGIDGVTHAAAVAAGEQLLAFVVGSADPARIRDEVAARLPEHLVPTTVTPVSDLPLTPTGKVDAAALLALPTAAPVTTAADGVEAAIADTWAEALGHPIGRDDRFFDVGGHSLLAAKVHRRLVERLGTPFPLTTLYAHPTVAALATHLTHGPTPNHLSRTRQRMARRAARRP